MGSWINRHDTAKCLDEWDTYKHLFVLPEGYTPDAPPTPRNSVSLNPVSESNDDDDRDTEIAHPRRTNLSEEDEGLIYTYHTLYKKYNDTLCKKLHIENNDRTHCVTDRQMNRPPRPCECYLHGTNEQYNALVLLLEEYEKDRTDFKEDNPQLVQEYYNRLIQPGGYKW